MTLDFDRVSKRFGTTVALDELTFSVPTGRIFGFLGANGAGKTTAMRICLGILAADDGAVHWDGTRTTDLPRRTFGYLPEERGLYPRMTIIDQLVYFASLYGEPHERARSNAHHWLERFRIPDYADRRAEELSKGNQQKVQFIAAILHDPEVLLMDEPFTGLDPVNLALLRDAFVELRDAGRTIVFSTHQMEAAEALCESLAIVDHGRLVAGGTLAELKRTSRARTVRLGVEGEILPAWLGSIDGVAAVRPAAGFTELELRPGTEPRDVLAAALARGALVTHFEVAEPSLEAVFIEHVGRPPDAEDPPPTLARRGRGLMSRHDPLLPNAAIVARREYLDRVRSKLFRLSTIVLMALALGVAMSPIAIRYLDRSSVDRILVISDEEPLALATIATANGIMNIPPPGVDLGHLDRPVRHRARPRPRGGGSGTARRRGRCRDRRPARARRASRGLLSHRRPGRRGTQPARRRSPPCRSPSSTGPARCPRAPNSGRSGRPTSPRRR